MAKQSTEVAVPQQFAVLQQSSERVQEVLAANLGNQQLGQFDFDRVRVPAGGGSRWTIPSLTGETEEAEITGIVVYARDQRAYWQTAFDDGGGGQPPDCSSDDLITGIGEPGGSCHTCPYAQFGSSNGRGQACKQIRLLFVLREHDVLPVVVVVPPTSLGPMKKYFVRLASQMKPYYGVITRLVLEKATNATGIKYSRILPNCVDILDEETTARIAEYRKGIEHAMQQIAVEARDVEAA